MSLFVGLRSGLRVGVRSGLNADTVGYATVAPGPGAVLLFGQSNAGGKDLATNASSFPGIDAAYPNVQMSRRGATLANPPIWVSEAKQDLQPRTAAVGGVSFAVGSCSVELKMGRDLDANSSGWTIIEHFLDGSGLEDNWLNASYPVSGGQLLTQLYTEIDAQLQAMGKTLKAAVWIQGEADSNGAPDAADYYANLTTLFDRIRSRYGDIAIVIVRLSSAFGSDAQSQIIRNAEESFVLNNSRARIVVGDELGFIDTAHYDANGSCTLGARCAAAIIDIANPAAIAHPRWAAQGNRVTAAAGNNLGPISWPFSHATDDIGVLIVSATGANAYPAPTGWTEIPDSPRYGGVALDARLQVFWRRATSAGEAAVTVTDVAGDDSKLGMIVTVRGCAPTGNPFDVTAGDNVSAIGSTAVAVPGDTSTVNNTLIMAILGHRTDAAVVQVTGWANADLTEVTEQVDVDTTAGLGYGIAIATGVRAVAGAFGTTTATLLSAVTQGRIMIAFKPA